MATEGFVKFEYFSKGIPPYYDNRSFPELLDDESIVISTPSLDMSYHQYFALFKKFMMAVGFDEKNIMQGACNLAFNEMNNENTMREVADEYDLIMSEQLPDIIADRKKQDEDWIEKTNSSWEQRYWALYHKMQKMESDELHKDLADKVQEGYSYWDEDAWNESMKAWNGVVPGTLEAIADGCICPILDNEEMPEDKKWIDVECPIHGRKNEGS